jgi:rRNA maturation protein Nop10
MEKETKADFIEDKCPRCGGTGSDPNQSHAPRRVADDPISGETQFQFDTNRCRQCGGTGRMPKGAPTA